MVFFRDEYVAGLDVAVNHSPHVQELHSTQELCHPLNEDGLREQGATGALLGNEILERAFAAFHYYVAGATPKKTRAEFHDVGVVDAAQHGRFSLGTLPDFVAYTFQRDLLHHVLTTTRLFHY